MVQQHFLSEFLQHRLTMNTEAPTGLIPALDMLEEYVLENPGSDVHLLHVPSVLEPDEPVARYSHIVPLVRTKILEELSVFGTIECKRCTVDWNTEARLRCSSCGQKGTFAWMLLRKEKKNSNVVAPELILGQKVS